MAVRSHAQQKSALTRIVNRGRRAILAQRADRFADPGLALAVEQAERDVITECRRAISEWNSEEWARAHNVRQGAWPDDWSRWQRAIDDVCGPRAPYLEDLESGHEPR